MAWLTAGWVRWSFLAAFEKLRSAATVAKTARSCELHRPIIISCLIETQKL